MELILKEEIKPFLFENGRIKHFEVFITPPPPFFPPKAALKFYKWFKQFF